MKYSVALSTSSHSKQGDRSTWDSKLFSLSIEAASSLLDLNEEGLGEGPVSRSHRIVKWSEVSSTITLQPSVSKFVKILSINDADDSVILVGIRHVGSKPADIQIVTKSTATLFESIEFTSLCTLLISILKSPNIINLHFLWVISELSSSNFSTNCLAAELGGLYRTQHNTFEGLKSSSIAKNSNAISS
jgi:hypothetical protein